MSFVSASASPSVAAPTALVLTSQGRDSQVAVSLLREAGVDAVTCGTVQELAERVGDDVGFVVVSEESLAFADLKPLSQWILSQPEWSDLPFIVLTRHG